MQKRRKPTRIMVSRTLTTPKTALAGVILESSFARLRPPMAALSEERTLTRPSGRWGPSAMAEAQGSWEDGVWDEGREEKSEP